jgi:hypothetical protein
VEDLKQQVMQQKREKNSRANVDQGRKTMVLELELQQGAAAALAPAAKQAAGRTGVPTG